MENGDSRNKTYFLREYVEIKPMIDYQQSSKKYNHKLCQVRWKSFKHYHEHDNHYFTVSLQHYVLYKFTILNLIYKLMEHFPSLSSYFHEI